MKRSIVFVATLAFALTAAGCVEKVTFTKNEVPAVEQRPEAVSPEVQEVINGFVTEPAVTSEPVVAEPTPVSMPVEVVQAPKVAPKPAPPVEVKEPAPLKRAKPITIGADGQPVNRHDPDDPEEEVVPSQEIVRGHDHTGFFFLRVTLPKGIDFYSITKVDG